jgi:hypothetical protein
MVLVDTVLILFISFIFRIFFGEEKGVGNVDGFRLG